MTDDTAAINRSLTDDERLLMKQLAIWTVAAQTGCTDEAAADWLDNLIETGLHMEGDAHACYIKTGNGHVIVHVTREWLAFFASHPDEPIDIDKYVTWFKHDRQEDTE